MINLIKARTPILALILLVFSVGQTFATNKVVVIPLLGDHASGSGVMMIPAFAFIPAEDNVDYKHYYMGIVISLDLSSPYSTTGRH